MRFMDSRSLVRKHVDDENLTIEGLAFKSDLSSTTIRNWVYEKRFVRPKKVRRILNAAAELLGPQGDQILAAG